jgi:hypothetical protein
MSKSNQTWMEEPFAPPDDQELVIVIHAFAILKQRKDVSTQ